MKKHLFLFGLTLGLFSINANAQDCTGGRYAEPIFTSVEKQLDIKYGNNLKQDGATPQDLFLDIYMPAGDVDTERPLILLAHGGSFIGGAKEDLAAQCEAFAKLGYVAVSMQYRLLSIDASVFVDIPGSFKKEVVRSIHDMKAAVRFFRKSAENGNPYGINPDIIIVGGFSAGAILANHATYIQRDDQIPADLVAYYQAQGGLEGNSGNPGYNSTPQMVLSWCGAILDTNMMETGMQPYFGMHTLGDQVVPNLEGEPNIGLPVPVTLQGDSLMYQRALNVGITSFYKSYPGSEHCQFPAESAQYVVDFVHEQVCVQNLSLENTKQILFSVYPNPAQESFFVDVPANEWEWNVSIVNMLGQTIHSDAMSSSVNRIEINSSIFDSGVYMVRLTSKDGKESVKKIIIQ